ERRVSTECDGRISASPVSQHGDSSKRQKDSVLNPFGSSVRTNCRGGRNQVGSTRKNWRLTAVTWALALGVAAVLFVACGSHDTKASGATASSSSSSSTEDANLTAADFPNINTMTPVGDHFVTNVRGHLDEALAVARSPQGGKYPVGTIIQLV